MYYSIDKVGELEKSISSIEIDEIKTIYYCLYCVNTECFIEDGNMQSYYPFLEFAVKKNENGHYSFPSNNYEHANFPSSEQNEEDKNQEDIYFENFNLSFILSFFSGDIHSTEIDFSKIYKGFIVHGNHLFVFCDCSTIKHFFSENIVFSILDEIIYKNAILETSVDPLIIDFFDENPEISKIYSDNDEEYPIPFQLYMVSVENDCFPIIEHEILPPAYYFTTTPLQENTKRYACFIINDYYILDDLKELEMNEKINENIHNSSTIYFHENDIQYWCVKNKTQFTSKF